MRRLLLGLAAAALAAGCGTGGSSFADPFPGASRIEVPQTLAGLRVQPAKEATDQLRQVGGERTYVADGWVYAIRLDNELKAIYEVIRLTPDARPGDPRFRRDILGQISGSRLDRPERIDGTSVYRAEQNEQDMFMWFEGRFLQLLIVRNEETVEGEGAGFNPRKLLQETVSLRPA